MPVTCVVCKHDQFIERWLLMNTRTMTLFNLDFTNKGALCLVCERCSYIHWFHTPELITAGTPESVPVPGRATEA